MFGPGKGYDPFFGELGGSFGSAIVGLNAHVGVRARVFRAREDVSDVRSSSGFSICIL
jgi:hypothetical protein